ncbi:immunoglobulin-like domain-containing protein [Konateibacter massiliensis]|uniref:immunoglobulin-like domain-containing protein n=1 Tax=Konateibacter massiliensis TaxID=2002841 RepID=UPI000C146B1E|nr:immunoglobulin-like domain-containing protein [Konateibacter massiliensis]
MWRCESVIGIGVMLCFFLIFFLFRKTDITSYSPSSKLFVPFYKVSVTIVETVFQRKKGMFRKGLLKPQVVDKLKQINPTDRTSMHIKGYYAEKIALSLLIIFTGNALMLLTVLGQMGDGILIEDKYIERGSYAEGKQSKALTASIEEEEQSIQVNISAQKLTKEEILKLFEQVKEMLPTKIMGGNFSLEEVRSNLKLPSKIEGIPVTIEWETDNFDVLGTSGEIANEDLEKEGVSVRLTATLSYQEYSDDCNILVKVLPPLLSEEEELMKQLSEEINIADESNATEQYMELPLNVAGKTIVWKEPKSSTGAIIGALGVLTSILIYYGKDKDLETKIKMRERQLLSDYPDIVSKLTLLLGAGMTVKSAWQKVALDYREKKEKNKKYYRYAYEEMLITYYEMMSGVSEAKAYEEFGKRAKNQRYLKLSSLITQNLRKGSRGLSQILGNESLDAFEDRKAYAKIAGEEAGTKLMMPMFLNLILVLIIIMIPACMSFQM